MPPLKYSDLTKEDFDAIVTGEMTHFAIWLEDELVEMISDYFLQLPTREDFQRLLLRRDGLTFQDKIEIVRALLPSFHNQVAAAELKSVLADIEEFKAKRNAFAHGRDVTPSTAAPALHIQTVNRSGKERILIVTPETHAALVAATETLLKKAQAIRLRLYVREKQQ
jgi:hypothetical protein